MKYRPFWCNIDRKFKNIDHLSKMVDYRPLVDIIDPVAGLNPPFFWQNSKNLFFSDKTLLDWVCYIVQRPCNLVTFPPSQILSLGIHSSLLCTCARQQLDYLVLVIHLFEVLEQSTMIPYIITFVPRMITCWDPIESPMQCQCFAIKKPIRILWSFQTLEE